jgi:hypothetical protein
MNTFNATSRSPRKRDLYRQPPNDDANNMTSVRRHLDTLLQLIRLPKAQLMFRQQLAPEHVRSTYAMFTKRHPRYKIIRNKTVGAALIDLRDFATREHYLDTIKARNCGAWHARRARSRGYVFAEIERNDHVDDIHAINTSVEQRQGRPMDSNYLEKHEHFEPLPHFRYYGVLDPAGRLVAYANFGMYGNFGALAQLIGHRNNDGIMHLLITEIVCRLIDDGQPSYIMYDTYFGAQPGLRQFKTIVGFKPYHAKFSLQ